MANCLSYFFSIACSLFRTEDNIATPCSVKTRTRFENFIASSLLKAVHNWTDQGFGEFGLFYLRDKQKKEVDFIITKDNQPWFIVEAKSSANTRLSPQLQYFQTATGAQHAFQVVNDLAFVEQDCFEYSHPIIVPAKTFLSQLR